MFLVKPSGNSVLGSCMSGLGPFGALLEHRGWRCVTTGLGRAGSGGQWSGGQWLCGRCAVCGAADQSSRQRSCGLSHEGTADFVRT